MTLIKKTSPTRATACTIDMSAISATTVDFSDANKPRIVDMFDESIDPGGDELHFKVIAKKHRLPKQPCALCLDLNEYQLVAMDAPEVPEEDLADALKWAVTEFVEKPVDDIVIDFFDVPNSSYRRDIRYVNVVVVEKETIEKKAELFKKAGLKLGIIDIPELAIRNLMNSYHLDDDGVVFLFLAKTCGLMVFVRDKQLYFSRKLEIGSDHLHQNPDRQQDIALEIQRSMDYVDRHFDKLTIKRLLVAPATPALPYLAAFLDENLAISCGNFDFSRRLDWGQVSTENVTPAGLLSLGTALRVDEKK